MQMHYRNNMKLVRTESVNNCVREPVGVVLAIISPKSVPTLRICQDTAQGGLELVKESFTQAWLPFVVPQRRGLQLLLRLRMTDDAHGACCRCPEQLAPPDGN